MKGVAKEPGKEKCGGEHLDGEELMDSQAIGWLRKVVGESELGGCDGEGGELQGEPEGQRQDCNVSGLDGREHVLRE